MSQALTAHRRNGFILEDRAPVVRTFNAATFELALNERPGMLSIHVIRIVVHCLIELFLQDLGQLAVFDVASNANSNFSDKDDKQEHRESQNHPARLAQCTAATQE